MWYNTLPRTHMKNGDLSLKQTCPQTVWVPSAESSFHIPVMLTLRCSTMRDCRICPEDPTHSAGRRATQGACYLVSSSGYCLELRAFGRAYTPVLNELAPLWAWTVLGLPLMLSPPSLYRFLPCCVSTTMLVNQPSGQSRASPGNTEPTLSSA